jgi:hypothetical protein
MRGFTEEVVRHQMTIESYGVKVRVCTNTPELLDRMESMLPPSSRKLGSGLDALEARRIGIVEEEDGTYCVYQASNRVAENVTLNLALIHFDDQVRSYVAVNSPGNVFVHAGAVAHGDRAIVIPGESFSGKSTLVEALVRQGAIYYSDEYAVFDQQGRVQPFAQPLSLRPLQLEGEPWSGDRSVESIGGVAGEDPIPLGLAVVTYYVPGADWSPRRLSPGEAAMALVARAVAARYRPQEVLHTLARAAENAVVLEGERGEADEFAAMLLAGAVA